MTRRGFALVATLWLLTIIGTLAATGLAAANAAATASRNRVLLARAEWARDGCFEIVQSRYHRWVTRGTLDDERIARELLGVLTLDSIALAETVWCSAQTADAGAQLGQGQRINLNAAPAEMLSSVPGLGEDGATAVVAERRGGKVFHSLDEVLAVVPSLVRQRIRSVFGEFAAVATTRPPALLIEVTGAAGGKAVRSVVTVVAAIGGDRLEILHREAE